MGPAKMWTVAVVVILVILALFLVLWARPQSACGDGVCAEGESITSCGLDCVGTCGDGFCNADGEDLASCPTDCAAASSPAPGASPPPASPTAPAPPAAADGLAPALPVGAKDSAAGSAPVAAEGAKPAAAPSSGSRCGDGSCQADENGAVCPSDCQPPGRCRDEGFRKIVAQVVKQCAAGCKFESKNPVVAISEAQFRALFSHASDRGIGVHFSIFGCNIWKSDNKDCWGYDAHYAESSQCPLDTSYECATRSDGPLCTGKGAQARCSKYAGAIEDGVTTFIRDWRAAKHLLLLGTASRTGNDSATGAMSQQNKDLALTRAANVENLIDRLRGEFEQAKTPILAKSYKVVLDNNKQFFDSDGFRNLVKAQMKAGKDGGFKPTTDNAINRSVMVIAVNCDLSGEDTGDR